MKFEFLEWEGIPPEGFDHQYKGFIELTDETRARMIKRAHDLGASIVEFHSHPFAKDAAFTVGDLEGLDEFVPHVWWRLEGRPYGAIVVGRNNFDGLVWLEDPECPVALDELRVGAQVRLPTQHTLTGWRYLESDGC
jgi:hypothetical protein